MRFGFRFLFFWYFLSDFLYESARQVFRFSTAWIYTRWLRHLVPKYRNRFKQLSYFSFFYLSIIFAANHKDYPNNKRSRENLACDESSAAAAAMNAGGSNGGRTPPLMRSCSSPAVYGKLISLIQFNIRKRYVCMVLLHIEHTTAACQLISTLFYINQFQITHTDTHRQLLIDISPCTSISCQICCLFVSCLHICMSAVCAFQCISFPTHSLSLSHLTFALACSPLPVF